MKTYQRSLIIAFVLFVVDAFVFNQGMIALCALFIVVFVGLPRIVIAFAKKNKELAIQRAIRCAIYVVMAVAVLTSNAANNRIAFARAKTMISACERFQAEHKRFPNTLDELVPNYLAAIPPAKMTLMHNSFTYFSSESEHTLMFVAMPPFGRPVYTLEAKKWSYLD